MNDRDLPVTRVERMSSSPPIDVVASPVPGHASLLSKVHRTLRGRYLWAVLLGLAGAAGGAYGGWKSQRPLYRAEGIIWVAASMPSPQDPAGMNVLPMFKGFMAYQVQLLTSASITNQAMQEEAWVATGEGMDPEAIQAFVKRRGIIHEPDSLHIVVTFEDPDPAVALAGVRAILAAYEANAQAQNAQNDQLRYATDQTELLAAQLKRGSDELLRLIRDFGSIEVLEMQHRASWTKVREAEDVHAQLLAALQAQESTQTPAAAPPDMTPGEIALENTQMAQATQDLALLEAREAAKALVLGEKHEELVALRQEIEVRRNWIERFTENWNRKRAGTAPSGTDFEDVRRREAGLKLSIRQLTDETLRLGNLLAKIHELEADGEDLKRKHERMKALKEELSARLEVKGRISISDRGRRPSYPSRDRRIAFATMGGLLGGFLGVLLVVLRGLRDRRFRDTGDVGTSLARLRLLGLLPRIPDDLSDPASAEIAAHCVHQIRTLLQIRRPAGRGAHFCITGPGVGSGKTTLSLALALSFARSGSRTLLIDADLSGRGLTRRVGEMVLSQARRLAGLEESPGGAGAEDRRLIEPLLARLASGTKVAPGLLLQLLTDSIEALGMNGVRTSGLINQVFALDDLLFRGQGRMELVAHLAALTKTTRAGASEAVEALVPKPVKELTAAQPELNGTPLDRYLYPTGLDTLRFMPLRGLGRGDLVSAKAIEGLLERASSEFDIVLVDTGPVQGAVETPIVAAATDGTVVVVSPGDRHPEAERAVKHLEDVGAEIRGLVFNRAAIRDVLKSSHSRSSMSTPSDAQ
jgi:Mrp family chromosome partitioning ATPase/uncharacterized protein involved in exopolysaccharide biosynthesis